MTYEEADKILQGRNREAKKIGNNTYLERRDEDRIALRLHSTDVLIFYPDGRVQMFTGGWKTVTTKDRLNYQVVGSVHAIKGEWFFTPRNPAWDAVDDGRPYYIESERVPFEEGMFAPRARTLA